MDLQLTGKRALITGSSIGIGAAIASMLAVEGTHVVIHGRDKERTEQVARSIVEQGGQASIAVGDLGSDEGAKRVAESALSSLGEIDILINNAGMYENHEWMEATPQAWATCYNANVLSAVRLIHLLVPSMKERGWGRIIQIASGEATTPFALMPDYSATKAALVNLTVSLAKALAGTGLTVNTVSPGIIVTPALEHFYRDMATKRGWGSMWEEIERRVLSEVRPNPTGRLGRVEDVAFLVTSLASPLASFINGANYRVDGGSTGTIN